MTKIEHTMQPVGSKLCAHACVAMALGISLDEAIAKLGHRGPTRNHEIVKALGTAGKFKPGPYVKEPCIIRCKGPDVETRVIRHHVVVYAQGQVFDPEYSRQAPSLRKWLEWMSALGWRVVSWLPLEAWS